MHTMRYAGRFMAAQSRKEKRIAEKSRGAKTATGKQPLFVVSSSSSAIVLETVRNRITVSLIKLSAIFWAASFKRLKVLSMRLKVFVSSVVLTREEKPK